MGSQEREWELKITFPFYEKGTRNKKMHSHFTGREREWNFPTGREQEFEAAIPVNGGKREHTNPLDGQLKKK